jgi:hypothetical protein
MNYLRAMPNERDLHNIETRKNAVYDAAFRGEIGDIPAALDALDAYGPGGGITSMAALPPLSVIEFGLHTKLNNISCIHEAVENVNTKFEALRAELNAASTLQCLIERSQAFNAALSDARDSMCNATHKILDVRHDDILTLYPRVLADTGLSEGNRLHKQLAAEITSCKKLRLTTLYMFALFREIRRDGRFVLDCALAGQPAGLRQALDGTISPALDLMNNIVKDADSDKKISDTAEIFKILKTLDKAQEERLKKLTWQLSRHRR